MRIFFLILFLLSTIPSSAQLMFPIVSSKKSNPPIVLDATCSGQSGGTSVSSISCGAWSSTVTSGDLILCAANDQGASPTTVSDSTNGSYKPIQYNSGNYPPGGSIGFYVFPNSAASATAPTMSMINSTSNASIQCSAWKNASLSYFDPKIDYWQINTSGAANPSTGLSQTPSFSGELVVGATMVNSTAPTAGSGFTLLNNPGACGGSNSCTYTEYQVQNSATATQCPWVATSQPFEASCIAIVPKQSNGTIGNLSNIYTSFEAGTNGAQLTSANLDSSTSPYPANSYEAPDWTGTAAAQLTVATACQHDLDSPVTVLGTTYTGTGDTRGVQYNWASANNTSMQVSFNNTSFPLASIGFFFNPGTIPTTDTTNYYPHVGINDGAGSDFVSLQMHSGEIYPETDANPNGNPDSCTGSGCDANNKFQFADNTWYWITIQFQQTGSHHLAVYTFNGTSWVLAADMAKVSTATSNPFYVKIGTADYASNTGTSCIDNLVIDSLGGHFPVLP